jgi:hypothetical protein
MSATGRRSSSRTGSRSALSAERFRGARARARVAVALAVTVCATCALVMPSVGLSSAPQRQRRAASNGPIPVSVTAMTSEPGPPVPRNFLGLSFEVAALPQIASYASEGNLVTMLRSLGVGVLRFGGVTADEQVGWTDEATPRPAWAWRALEPANLRELGSLTGASGWGVLLTLGFGHFEPQAAAREAAVAKAALGSSLEAIEIGNEPDSYARHGLRAAPWTPEQYNEQVDVYRGAIEALAPGIPLAGPDPSGSSAYEKWGLSEAIYQRPAMLTGHHYPLGCAQHPAPTISLLLSPRIRELEERSLHRYVFIAQETEVPFRLDETNSVSCGGVPGISDTFASALWAVSYVTQAMSMGAAGINLQGNPTNCVGYTPICAPNGEAAATGKLEAQPDWYALLLAKALVGERPLRTIVGPAHRPNVVARAFGAADGTTQFVLVDDDPPGSRGAAMRLHVGAGFHGATVLSLTAPSPQALSGVKLGGRPVAANGSWSQPPVLPHAANRNGVITVDLAPSSAALVTVAPKG